MEAESAATNHESVVETVDGEMDGVEHGLFAATSAENAPVKEDRMYKKAKRTLKVTTDGGAAWNGLPAASGSPVSPAGHSPRGKSNVPFSKNSRKSRNFTGRGQPKKGGAGGKGVWGKPGEELDDAGVCDVHDPNYDSDSQGAYKLEKVIPVLTDDQLDSAVKPIIQEYLEHGNTGEVEDLLSQLNIGSNRHKIAKLAVVVAMDRHNPQREMISRLISDLYSGVLSQQDIARGFDELLQCLDDLRLDTPDAHNLLGQFIARCVADDCLPPKFIMNYKGKVESDYVKSALEKAEVLLTMNHGIAHLDNIWGVGGGNRPVKYLTNKIVDLLKEYVNSGDNKEAMKCLQELDVPHFHHELVYQAIDMAIEDSSERIIDMMVGLLDFLTKTNVITIDQFEKGARRLYHDINDINLDVPAAYTLLDTIAGKLHAKGVLGENLMKDLPSRGRKRFVSEGDGGKLKQS
jgi:programmed cell death protein 4